MSKRIVLIGWNEGFEKVNLNLYLQEEIKLRLKEAKIIIDTLLRNEEIYISLDEAQDLEAILEKLRSLKVRVDVERYSSKSF